MGASFEDVCRAVIARHSRVASYDLRGTCGLDDRISASATLINRSLTVPSSPAVRSAAVTAWRLGDRTRDFEFYEPIVVHSEFA
jgi:hypothetical protein